jgi:protease II
VSATYPVIGVVYGYAHVRGGLINGGKWYSEGRNMLKQNTFSDFISASEYLIESGWTTPDQFAIEGASAGGLLVGAVVTQRPDLFKVSRRYNWTHNDQGCIR